MQTDLFTQPSHQDTMALFRHAIVGDLVHSQLCRGELQQELKRRAERRYRPPTSNVTRTYHWKTLQRWLLSAREGVSALRPVSRRRGFALALDEDARELLLEMRREHPTAAADLILEAAIQQGAIEKSAISVPTLRRLFAREGLSRRSKQPRHLRAKDRRRWETDRVGRVWHADVCHVWRRTPEGGSEKVYVHGIIDDHSRYVIALKACVAETENDLLELLVEALLRYPAPEVFYVDNGSTYRGHLLTLAFDKLGVRVLHAAPYDPEARGKMERFWRTLRQRLLDLDDAPRSLYELNAALLAWLDTDYHRRKHGGLMGETPGGRFRAGLLELPGPRSLEELAAALEVHRKAKVRKDATFSVNSTLYEVRGRHLCGRSIDVVIDPFTRLLLRASHEETPVVFGRCDPQANAKRSRGEPEPEPEKKERSDRFQRIARVLQAARELTHES